MPASLHRRAAATASANVSPATKRRAMRRVVPLEITQVPNFLFSESFRSADRSMRSQLWQAAKSETSAVPIFLAQQSILNDRKRVRKDRHDANVQFGTA